MMKSVWCAMAGVLLLAPAASAQGPGGRGGPVSLAQALQRAYAQSKQNLTEEAEKMPEADYSFKPSMEIRSYGQLFGHVANAMFNQCAQAKGAANPNQGTDLETKTMKAEIVKALADAFAFCDDAFSGLTDENAAQRGPALIGLLTHNNEMYGIGTVYMRLKNLVPPSTERQGQRGRGGPGGGAGGGGGRGRGRE